LKVTPTELPEVLLLEPTIHSDERGYLFEAWNRATFEAAGIKADFVQDNQSRSRKNVIRGLHYQVPPHPQAKLLRVVSGEIFDVAVDIRRSSPNFGKWTGAVLSAENKRMLWVPEGFAHGLLALSDECEIIYKIAGQWSRESERAIRWDDPEIGVQWPLTGQASVSGRDRSAPALSRAEVFA
jgi:dTDP-4-dehydrorhamnose 3,5-epimerase